MNKPIRINALLVASACAGLSKAQKTLEAKWFYDHAGSELFEQITQLPEYYPTRTEIRILGDNIEAIAKHFPARTSLVELGSGASTKTRLLLDGVDQIESYIPLDISGEFLQITAAVLEKDFPAISVQPVVADFMEPVEFGVELSEAPKVAFFPGSTLGNLETHNAVKLMSQVRQWPEVKGFLLGVDLAKSVDRLIAAYDDAAGVTAAFNLNVLHRLNREAGGTIDVSDFQHEARWNEREARIEMHLVARRATRFVLDGNEFALQKGESIHTENSHKYTQERLDEMAAQSGWMVSKTFTDNVKDFAVCYLKPAN